MEVILMVYKPTNMRRSLGRSLQGGAPQVINR